MAVWINEFHYDNAGADFGEFIEIAGTAGTDLSGWKLVLYNGSDSRAYGLRELGGVIADQRNGFGTVSFAYPANGLQNGSPDGFALIDPAGAVVQFLSYEGVITAADGLAVGRTSTDVGVFEPGTALGTSIGLTGSGDEPGDFTWTVNADDTPGSVNNGQTFGTAPPPAVPGAFSIADVSVVEGDGGVTPISFIVTRGSDSNVAASVSYAVAFSGTAGGASADDLSGPLSGVIAFAANETSRTIVLNVVGDALVEGDEAFTVTLSAPTDGATIADGTAAGVITDDDTAAPAPAGEVFINEIHYDNSGTDAGEAIEIAATAGTNLAGWQLVLYSTSTGATVANPYDTRTLSGVVPAQDDGFGTLSFSYPVNGIQNGPQDGVALVDPTGRVVQFLSWEGVIVGGSGPAAGLTSQDIGVSQTSAPIGASLQLVGAGTGYADFEWRSSDDDSFGSVNAGQDFINGDVTGEVRVGDARVVEGDNGTTEMVFTVRRAGGQSTAASVEYLIGTSGSAGVDDLAPGQPLRGAVSFAAGQTRAEVRVAIAGDVAAEPNETFTLTLANPVGNIRIVDGEAVGTIVNDDPIAATIAQIQGAAHRSPLEGQVVTSEGVVTLVRSNGFYVQDPTGDGDARTSEAVFVFTRTAPTVALGDAVRVRGEVGEFQSFGANLPTTQIAAETVAVLSSGNALPTTIEIGVGGLLPPSEVIEDDGLTSFDPLTDGLDFFEALEGMRVTVDAPRAVANAAGNNLYVVASNGEGATGLNSGGGITITATDFNPERIRLFDGSGALRTATRGDELADVTGVVGYFGSASAQSGYEVIVTKAAVVTKDVALPERETTDLVGGRDHLTVASYNVENLDLAEASANGSPDRFDLLARDIVFSLKAPDIIGVQEIQDANGAAAGGSLSGVETAQELIDRIATLGGPSYVYVEIAPTTPNSTGGQANGNIRNGYLYNAARVDYVDGSARLIEGPAFEGTRRPLVADFTFNGETVKLVNVHLTSRIGSDPLSGDVQPPANAGDGARVAQVAAVKAYLNDQLAVDPTLKLGVLGDFNAFYFEESVTQLEGGVLTNLHRLLPPEERYTYEFDGNAQAIDTLLVSGGLLEGARFDVVHINAEQLDDDARASDHDPILGRFLIEAPNRAPTDLVIDDANVAENAAAGTVVGTVSATDADGDLLSYSLVDDAGGLFAIDRVTGAITTRAPFDFETRASYDVTARAADPDGAGVERTLTITVTDVNEAPVAAADAIAVKEDATSGNLWDLLLGNDRDVDTGTTLSIQSVDGSAARGTLVLDVAARTLFYVADDDSFDGLLPGQKTTDRFGYTVTDGQGLTSAATVDVTVTGVFDTEFRFGGNRNDVLETGGGEDFLYGGNGDDTLSGGAGHDLLFGDNGRDRLFGGEGADVLRGGNGDDRLSGGEGADLFGFGRGGGADTILDFDVGEDAIALDWFVRVGGVRVSDVDRDGVLDLTVSFTNGAGSVTLLGVSDFSAVRIGGPELILDHPIL